MDHELDTIRRETKPQQAELAAHDLMITPDPLINTLDCSASLRLENQVAVVSGGARGIGAGIVRRFVEEGARVVFSDLLNERGKALEEELGKNVAFRHADASSPSDTEALMWSLQSAELKLTPFVPAELPLSSGLQFFRNCLRSWSSKSQTSGIGDALAFYKRTFVTEGMGRLLTQGSQRLDGKGGEPSTQRVSFSWEMDS